MKKLAIVLLVIVLLGGVFMVAQPLPVEAANTTYTVQKGDTLSGIASHYGITVSAIAQANGIVNVNNIFVGQVLKIPTGTDTTTTTPTQSQGEAAYLVQPGDSLTSVAAKFGISVYQLASANNLSVVSYLYVGQTLKIPGQGGAPSNSSTTAPATTAPKTVAPTNTPVPTTTTVAPTNTPVPTTTVASKPAQSTKYTVVAGDTLSTIANKFGVTVQDIVNANNISDPNVISVGMVLTIPGASGTAPNPVTTQALPQPNPNPASTGKWIDVNLSKQRLTAYEGSNPVFSSLVSTGVSYYPTVVGTFNIYVKYQAQLMTGGSGASYYYLPNVPYVMYFYQAYAIHGTYWHNNFGHPMSHGCVNLPTPAAQWMYNWAPIGTPVKVHY